MVAIEECCPAVLSAVSRPQSPAVRILEPEPVTGLRWGLSVLDWQAHAVDPAADHPIGVYRARCGHLLMVVTELHERPPGAVCAACEAP
jgi:hypothetical protein